MDRKSSRFVPDKRWLAAGATALAGLTLLGWAVLQPPKEAGVPGWTPVNGQVTEALVPASKTEETAPGAAVQPLAAESPAPSGTAPASPDAIASSPLPSASEPAAPESVPDGRLNLNAATAEQLDELKGIGPSKAQAIIAYREEHGAFKSVEELLQVNGIGAKVFAAIRDSLKV